MPKVKTVVKCLDGTTVEHQAADTPFNFFKVGSKTRIYSKRVRAVVTKVDESVDGWIIIHADQTDVITEDEAAQFFKMIEEDAELELKSASNSESSKP